MLGEAYTKHSTYMNKKLQNLAVLKKILNILFGAYLATCKIQRQTKKKYLVNLTDNILFKELLNCI